LAGLPLILNIWLSFATNPRRRFGAKNGMAKENSMDHLEQFQAYLLSRDKSPKTIQGYGADLRQFQKWVGRLLETITSADVRAYRDHLISIGACFL